MIKNIAHIGITVTDADKSALFYRDVLGLEYVGEMYMKGDSTDELFDENKVIAKVVYLRPKDTKGPDVELIEFKSHSVEKDRASLFKTSISELCFGVEDIDSFYRKLLEKGVKCISGPQEFDSREYGFGKSKAFYFYDLDDNILEAIESID